MTPMTGFSVQAVEGGFRCIVNYHGQPLSETFNGGCLCGAWRVGEQFLLLISDANGYEDWSHLHLLDKTMKRLETVHLGGVYTFGETDDIEATADGALRFTFPNFRYRWQVTVLRKPQWRIGAIWPFSLVTYSRKWRTQLRCNLISK
jgi:hypothetical protein